MRKTRPGRLDRTKPYLSGRFTASATRWLLQIEGPNTVPANTRKAWETLAGPCGRRKLYERVANVGFVVVLAHLGRKDILGRYRNFPISDRSAERLAIACEKLARKLQNVSHSKLGKIVFPEDQLPGYVRGRAFWIRRAPKVLRRMLGAKSLSPITLAEANVIQFVKAGTGAYHFEEVSTLLEAACMVAGGTGGRPKLAPSYDAPALERRFRRLMKSAAAQILASVTGQ